jgi:hypothetical protein
MMMMMMMIIIMTIIIIIIIIIIIRELFYFPPDHKANMRTRVKVQVRLEVTTYNGVQIMYDLG